MNESKDLSVVQVSDDKPPEDERIAQMRQCFERQIARNPTAMILFFEVEGESKAVAGAVGSEIALYALHREGTNALAAMLGDAHQAVDERSQSAGRCDG